MGEACGRVHEDGGHGEQYERDRRGQHACAHDGDEQQQDRKARYDAQDLEECEQRLAASLVLPAEVTAWYADDDGDGERYEAYFDMLQKSLLQFGSVGAQVFENLFTHRDC